MKSIVEVGSVFLDRWKVIKMLGSGGCGVVHLVVDIQHRYGDQDAVAALKTRSLTSSTIQMDAYVLRHLRYSISPHFAHYIDSGRNYLLMSILGRSLSSLRHQRPHMRFSTSTSIRLALQCLQSIVDLHLFGFVHRDIKSSNFAIGIGQKSARIVHLIDFGLCRHIILIDQHSGVAKLRPSRVRVSFRGTYRYCSSNVHAKFEHGRHDDLWSLLYMIVEMITGTLPWRSMNRRKTAAMKRMKANKLLIKCPSELNRIVDHLLQLDYYSRPDYDLIHRALMSIVERKHWSLADSFDWEES